ncbi:MAG: hypothetical protein J6Y89_11000 [Lachnospiraceae bacterium]|nr:hypothetical protein [Lachnospiraceae bacterium]
MSGLQVKTYCDRNPRGLVRILFFAADEDYDKYLDDISDRILRLYPHVAVYYSRDPGDITDEVLSQMRLAVCPATMSFLSINCKARKLLFRKIQQLHIALLPIGMERGIEYIFNKICGEIQFLDAIGYLRELSKVLIYCREYDRSMWLSSETYRQQTEMDERFPDEWNELIRAGILREMGIL